MIFCAGMESGEKAISELFIWILYGIVRIVPRVCNGGNIVPPDGELMNAFFRQAVMLLPGVGI